MDEFFKVTHTYSVSMKSFNKNYAIKYEIRIQYTNEKKT